MRRKKNSNFAFAMPIRNKKIKLKNKNKNQPIRRRGGEVLLPKNKAIWSLMHDVTVYI
jgi:hypothetical protein